MTLNNRGNWSLVGLLAAVAIVAVVAALFVAGGRSTTVGDREELLDKESQKQTTVGRAIDTAKATDCRERIRQTRLGIDNYRLSNESSPPSLKDAGLSVSTDYFNCPVSGKPYVYDPASGRVSCPTHTDF